MIEILKNKSDYNNQITELYTSSFISLNLLAQMTKHSLFEVWNQIKFDSQLMLWAHDPSQKRKVKVNSRYLLCDLGFLFIFQHLGRLDLVTSTFSEIYFYQRQYTEILEGIKQSERDRNVGKKSIGYNQENLFITDTPNSFFEERLTELIFLKKWIDSNCELVGDSFYNIFDEEELLESYDFNLINLAVEEGYLLGCDSLMVSKILEQKGYDDIVISSYGLLEMLVKQEKLSLEEYYSMYVELQLINYETLPIEINAIQDHLKKTNYHITDKSKQLLLSLTKKELAFSYRLSCIIVILQHLINKIDNLEKQKEWIAIMLNLAIQQNEINQKELIEFLRMNMPHMNIAPVKKEIFNDYLDHWLKD